MTLVLEASPTTGIAEAPVQRPDDEPPAGCAAIAALAHALLSQTVTDEELDDLVATAARSDRTFSLPPCLFG